MTDSTMVSQDISTREEKTVYVYFNPKLTVRVCLKFGKEDIQNITLSDLISKSIKILTEEYLLQINQSKSSYCLFPANKTGSKRDGYPELDTKLLISKVHMRKFYLQEVNKAFSLISTEYNLQRKYGIEKKVRDQGSCCSFFKLLSV